MIAWFDHRGGHEIEQLAREAPGFPAAFERTTGLRWSSQATLAKLLWLAPAEPAGLDLAERAEWIVFALGGDLVREPSLAPGLVSSTRAPAASGRRPWRRRAARRILPDERPAVARPGSCGTTVSCPAPLAPS